MPDGTQVRGKYAVVGVGETEYSRNSGRTTRAMAVEAIRNAIADAGLLPAIGETSWGMLTYVGGGQPSSATLGHDLGMRLDFYMDCQGGGSSTEALCGMAMGVIEADMCDVVIIYRTMNGYTELRIGGTGHQAPAFGVAHGG